MKYYRLDPERVLWHRDKPGAIRLWLKKLCLTDEALVINGRVGVKRNANTRYAVYDLLFDDEATIAERRASFKPGSRSLQTATSATIDQAVEIVLALLDAA